MSSSLLTIHPSFPSTRSAPCYNTTRAFAVLMFFGILLRLPWIWTVTATYWIPITKSLQAAAYYKNVLSLSISDAVGTNIRTGSASAAKQTTKSIIRRIDSFKGASPGSSPMIPKRSPHSTQSLRDISPRRTNRALESLGGSVMHTSLRAVEMSPSLSPQRQSRTRSSSSPRSPSRLLLRLSPRLSPRVAPCSPEGNNVTSSLELALPPTLHLDSVEGGVGGNADRWVDAALQETSTRAGGGSRKLRMADGGLQVTRMADALKEEDAT